MLETMLRKQAATLGPQWDRYLSGLLWTYQNTPHEATEEKPSFLLFGIDCRIPTEAALLPPKPVEPTTVPDYRKQVILSLSTARKLAVESIKKAQHKYKAIYERKTAISSLKIGDWVLVKFPQDEVGKLGNSRLWHSPYRVISRTDPDITVVRVYTSQDKPVQVHLSRVTRCPSDFLQGYYWYGTRRHSPGCHLKWIQRLFSDDACESAYRLESIMEASESEEENLVETAIQSSFENEPHPGTLDLT